MFYSQAQLPSAAVMQRWLDQLADAGFDTIRTGAVSTVVAGELHRHGFSTAQELALLEHTDPGSVRGRSDLPATHRLLAAAHADAASVDLAAFGPTWGTDQIGVTDICKATTRHRARGASIGLARGADGPGPAGPGLAGYAISGRDSRTGFLQRLAVHPSQHGHHLGLALTVDSLKWMARWRVQRVLVNTHTDNVAALALYERTGFTRLPDHLHVLERAA